MIKYNDIKDGDYWFLDIDNSNKFRIFRVYVNIGYYSNVNINIYSNIEKVWIHLYQDDSIYDVDYVENLSEEEWIKFKIPFLNISLEKHDESYPLFKSKDDLIDYISNLWENKQNFLL